MITVNVNTITWDSEEDLPTEVEIQVPESQIDNKDDLIDYIMEELSNQYSYCVESFDYEICK